MTKEKKQLIVVGVLAALILGIGAFQFLGRPKPAPVAKNDKPKHEQKQSKLVAKADAPDATQQYVDLLVKGSPAPRDPFVAQAVLIDEKENKPNTFRAPVQQPTTTITGSIPPVIVRDPEGNSNVSPVTKEPPYSLRGIVIGRKTFAVIKPAGLEQILVQEGYTFNDGTQVVSITEGQVVLKRNGTVKTLAFQGGIN
ncbi:MAG TPA: hypothetical protein VNI20_05845 [Fimbriimonadaceae bacterium]|nr:hypothetical protein [Fimbriimonadaceae bacterium]